MATDLDKETLLVMMRRMLLIRRFEERVEVLYRRGEIAGGLHLSIGEEAAAVGACMALRRDDRITGTHRSHGHPIAKGAEVHRLMAELFGKATGICKGRGGSMHLADFSIGSLGESGVVASAIPVAVGAALASRLRGLKHVVLCFFGDGAVNSGAFHEALNLAALWKLPVVFFCENNFYAIGTHVSQSCAAKHVVDRAKAYDMPGLVVDGQDVLKVYEAVKACAERARAGEGPSFVECQTYRYKEHSQRVPIPTYRPQEEIAAWERRDPVVLFRDWLVQNRVATAEGLDRMDEEAKGAVEEAVAFARESPYPGPESVWEGTYVEPLPTPYR